MIWYASPISCMSPYSMPLCTIFTKWPAPSAPTQSQQGTPSTFAAIACRSGFRRGHAAADPPGIRLGPFSAPSSPPDTPQPTKLNPFSSTYFARRMVSRKFEFPPSMTISPGDRSGRSPSSISSTGLPARIISMILRGGARLWTNSGSDSAPRRSSPLPRPERNARTFAGFRL